jgi:hypothetical protein
LSRLLAWTLLALTVALTAVGLVLAVIGERRGLELPSTRESIFVLVVIASAAALLHAAVGFVIVRRRPENPIGWIFLASAPVFVVFAASSAYADLSLYGEEAWPLDTLAAWLTNWTFSVVFATPVIVAQLFPDGRPVSRPWSWVFRATVAMAVVEFLTGALRRVELDQYPGVMNPVALPGGLGDAVAALWDWGSVFVAPFVFLAALASLVARFRRSRGVERQQLKWLAFTGALMVVGFSVATTTGSGVVSDVFFVLGIAALVLMPIAVAIAILRYRLYEIDRVISKTLVYAVLTVILGAAYAGLVIGGQALFSSFAGGSHLAIAVSTLVVAGLFLPLRSRVQGLVDRRFYRRRYDAQRTLEAFGTRLRDELDLETLAGDLRGVVTETMQPAHATVWLRHGGPR